MLDNELPPLGGGMGTTNLALLRIFAQNPELEIDVITSALHGKRDIERFSDRIRIFKVPVWNRNIHHSSNRELIFYAVQALFLGWQLHLSRRYDFCFAWSALPAGGVAITLYRLFRLPYMVWVSGPDIPGFEQRYNRLYRWLTPLIRKIWQNASPLIAKCREEVLLIQQTEEQQEVTIIPNGVDVDFFRPGVKEAQSGPVRILCTARLIERKGQQHLILAAQRLIEEGLDVEVVLVGTGDSMEAYRSLVQNLGLENRIHFLGYVPREEITQNYNTADIFCLPSYYEGMSLAALEALSSGLPLVLTRTGGTQDLVEEGVNGLTFEWGDIDKLVEHLRLLAENRELMRTMGIASRQRAQQFSWNTIARQYYELFSGMGKAEVSR